MRVPEEAFARQLPYRYGFSSNETERNHADIHVNFSITLGQVETIIILKRPVSPKVSLPRTHFYESTIDFLIKAKYTCAI